MSQQAIQSQPPAQGNQKQQAPPPDPMFEEGRAIFLRLVQNQHQEYSQFKKLNEFVMMASINSLQFWKNIGGPQSQNDKLKCRLYLQSLKQIQQKETNLRRKFPGFFIDFTRWLDSLGHSESAQENKPSISQKDNTATYGSDSLPSQFYGLSKRLSDGQKINVVEQDETKHLKSQ